MADNESATGNEAENAMRMAEGLLRKHSIKLFDLRDKEDVGISFHDYGKRWEQTVYSAITKLYNCKLIITHQFGGMKLVIIGTESNRITSEIVIKQLISQIKKDTKGEKDAFRNGAVNKLFWNCMDIIKERNKNNVEAIPGTGIMNIDIESQNKSDIDDWCKEHVPNLRKGRKTSAKIDSRGMEYGSGLNPGARVDGSGQKCLN